MAATSSFQLNNIQHDTLIEYYKAIQTSQREVRSLLRGMMERIDKEYQRENDETVENKRALLANRRGDANKYRNVTVPVVKPQVEIAAAYQNSVFLSGVPMFGVVHDPAFMDEAIQMETLIDEQARLGGWGRHFQIFFRDCFKYNFGPLEVDWHQEVTYAVDTDLLKDVKKGVPKEVVWSGNRIKRLNPYNTIVDPIVTPSELYLKGDFGGYTELLSRMQLKQFLAQLPNKQTRIREAFESPSTLPVISSDMESADFYVPQVNPEQELRKLSAEGTNWMKWAGLEGKGSMPINYKDAYHKTVLYGRIMPGEFDLKVPGRNTPQIWKFIIINHHTIVYAERQTNAHNWIPILIGQPLEDGLEYQTKSLAADGEPFQQSASAFMNSIIASRRRSISDRLLYDPSRVTEAQINNPNPAAKIPVRPAAYGKSIQDAVYQFPYREDQNAMGVEQIRNLLQMADSTNGQNPARQGQFVKGNKTREEFNDIMDNSVSRDVMASLMLEAQVFMPAKHILKVNILQFQGTTVLQSQAEERSVNIDPVALRKAALSFRVSDGLIPSSKIISTENFSVALQTIANNPLIGGGYNIVPMFSYLMKTKGANLKPFEKSPEQIAYEQAMAQWTQLVTLVIEKSADGKIPTNFPPQPLPEQFNYVPSGPAAKPPATALDQETFNETA